MVPRCCTWKHVGVRPLSHGQELFPGDIWQSELRQEFIQKPLPHWSNSTHRLAPLIQMLSVFSMPRQMVVCELCHRAQWGANTACCSGLERERRDVEGQWLIGVCHSARWGKPPWPGSPSSWTAPPGAGESWLKSLVPRNASNSGRCRAGDIMGVRQWTAVGNTPVLLPAGGLHWVCTSISVCVCDVGAGGRSRRGEVARLYPAFRPHC